MAKGSTFTPKQTLTFKFEKETPGTYRYQEQAEAGGNVDKEAAKIGQLYVKKGTFNGEKPDTITVLIGW